MYKESYFSFHIKPVNNASVGTNVMKMTQQMKHPDWLFLYKKINNRFHSDKAQKYTQTGNQMQPLITYSTCYHFVIEVLMSETFSKHDLEEGTGKALAPFSPN